MMILRMKLKNKGNFENILERKKNKKFIKIVLVKNLYHF